MVNFNFHINIPWSGLSHVCLPKSWGDYIIFHTNVYYECLSHTKTLKYILLYKLHDCSLNLSQFHLFVEWHVICTRTGFLLEYIVLFWLLGLINNIDSTVTIEQVTMWIEKLRCGLPVLYCVHCYCKISNVKKWWCVSYSCEWKYVSCRIIIPKCNVHKYLKCG